MSSKKKKKSGGALVYLSIALLLILMVIFVSSSVSPHNADLLVELNATPTPTPTATPTPTPTPLITPTPAPTLVPQPSTTPALRYAGTTVKGISILEKSRLDKDHHIYNIMSAIPTTGLPIPRLYQFNYKTPICYFYGGRKTVSSSGCGPTCVSMITAWVKKNYDQTPYTQMYRAAEVGDYFGAGLTVDGLQHMLQLNDIVCWQEDVSAENILAALKANRPCVMRMGPGTFTRAGHYIILRGIDPLGKILVNDPNSEDHSYTSYDVSLIARQAKKKTFVVVGSMEEQTGVTQIIDTGVSIVTTQAPISAVSIGFATALESASLRENPGSSMPVAAKLEKGTVLEIIEKRTVSGDEKVWYGVAYNGAEYFIRSNYVAAQFYELDPDETPEPDSTDDPDPETAA